MTAWYSFWLRHPNVHINTALRTDNMETGQALLIILIVILLCFVIFKSQEPGADGCAPDCGCSGEATQFHSGGQIMDASHTVDTDAHQLPKTRNDMESMQKQIRALEASQYNAWAAATPSDGWAPESVGCKGELDMMNRTAPPIDYQTALTDMVVDRRMLDNHNSWTSEIAPKSQTALKVDTIDEAAAMSIPRVGLNSFRMSAPQQHNPLFVTELDAPSLAKHATRYRLGSDYCFNG